MEANCQQNRAWQNFAAILSSLNRKFDIIHTKWTEEKLFEVKFRTQIQRNSDDFNALCDEWVDLFSEATGTVWVKKISNTGPKIRFRKQYQCWPQNSKDVQKELLFDSRRCKGTLDMKVLTDNPLTRRKNKHIRLGLNVVVKINFTHLHIVDTSRDFAFFIHICEPQLEAPKPIVQTSSDKLSQKVAEMVQKGLNASPKVVSYSDVTRIDENIHDLDSTAKLETLQQASILNLEAAALSQVLGQPQLAQVIVNAPSLEMGESLLMCQPTLVFDPTQLVPVAPHHFVQLHSQTLNPQGNFL